MTSTSGIARGHVSVRYESAQSQNASATNLAIAVRIAGEDDHLCGPTSF